ncbi:MAG TPA: FG-GAP-like repeat-containing protein [Gammaproteobacteria bacterium]|nr:FG-GAP-like repeat-containing protein [Gammaproteobacteria bacterium]
MPRRTGVLSRVPLMICLPLALCACGGGGSGASGPSPSAPPPGTPPPKTELEFSDSNALDALGVVLLGVDQAVAAGEAAATAAEKILAHALNITNYCGPQFNQTVVSIIHRDTDGNGTLSEGDEAESSNGFCYGVSRTIALRLTAVDPVTDALAGDLDFDVGLESGVSIKGSAQLAYSAASGTKRWRLTNVSVTVTSQAATETFSSAAAEKTVDAEGDYSVSSSGEVDSARFGGQFSFATTNPLTGTYGTFPAQGELVLTAGESRIRAAANSLLASPGDYVDYAVDSDGAGYAAAQSAVWSTLMLGSMFGWQPNLPPEITRLDLDPPNPVAADTLFANYSTFDGEGDPLETTLEWRRNGQVIAGENVWYLQAGGNRKGDVIAVTVTVTDGRQTITKTTSVTIQDAVPKIADPAIAPDPAYTDDDLTFARTITDADGDALQTTYVWKRNGEVIAGQTGPVLPASEHQRGDVIDASIAVSDGDTEITAQATATIADSPPRVSVASPPTDVAYGDAVAFTATVADPDGDSTAGLHFALAYGPAGMTVDPANGAVSWIVKGPMFGDVLDANWGVTVDRAEARIASGTLHVADAARQYPLARTGVDAPLDAKALRVGDFDGDGGAEMLILGDRTLYELAADGAGEYRQTWAYPFRIGSAALKALAVGDVDGDGKQEIYVAAGSVVARLDGVNRRLAESVDLGTNINCLDLEYGDLDGDGSGELVCLMEGGSTGGGLLVLHAADLSLKWRFPDVDYGGRIAIGNVDADPALEIVTANGYVFDGKTYDNQWLYGPGFGNSVDVGDVDGDGVDEIFGTNNATGYLNGYRNKASFWQLQTTNRFRLADVDGDGVAEIVIPDYPSLKITAYGFVGQTAATEVVFQLDESDGVLAIAAGDVDGDGETEVIWSAGFAYSVKLVVAGRNPDPAIEWQSGDPARLDGPFVGGLLAGDTTHPPGPVFASVATDNGYAGTRLIRMTADSGDLMISEKLGSLFGASAALTVADYDGDAADEIFLATPPVSSGGGPFLVYNLFGAEIEWQSPPTESHGIAAAHADLNGDGKDDFVVLDAAGLYAYDVFGSTLLWRETFPTAFYGADVSVADVDADGVPEILVATATGALLYSRSTGPQAYVQTAAYTLPDASRYVYDADIGDTDGDGDPEIFLLGVGMTPTTSTPRVYRLDSALNELGSFDLTHPAHGLAIEASAFPRKNLVVSTYDDLVSVPREPSMLIAVDSTSGAEVWRSPILLGRISPNSVQFVEPNGAGELRIAVGTSAAMYLTR